MMLMRLKRNPTTWLENVEGGGGGGLSVAAPQSGPAPTTPQQGALPFAAPPQAQVQPAPQVQQQPQPQAPASVALPADEVARLYGLATQFQQFQAAQQAEAERLRNEALVAQAKKGEVDQAFASFREEQDRKYQALERQYLDGERERTVSGALATASAGLRPECVEMVRELASKGLVSVRDPQSGRVVVQDAATGRPAAEVIKERLASPAFAVFYLPSSQGGSRASGAAATVATPPAGGSTYETLGEAVVAQWQARAPGNPMIPTLFGRR